MAFTQNSRILIATFDDYSTARQAARELEQSGVPSSAIQIDSNRKTAGAGSAQYQTEEHESGFKEWWNSLFGSDDDRDRTDYEGALSGGRSILRVTVADETVSTAVDILNRNGARDVGNETTAAPAAARSLDTRADKTSSADRRPIEVVEEEMQIGKRAVRRGGVRVYSHLVTRPVEEQVRLREEHVNVDRRKVDREISPAEVNALRDQTIEVTEMAEEPVIAKRARVREEIVVDKQATERTETVRDNLRRTEVEVEQLGPETRTRETGSADLDSGGYEYGYAVANDSRFRGRSWDEVETAVRSDYERSHPNGKWEEVKQSIRNGWDRFTTKR